jgi:hypothetical protein
MVGLVGLMTAGCQKPTVCPVGWKEDARGDTAVWCRSRDGKQALYFQLDPGSRRKRQRCPFEGGVLEGEFQSWHPDGRDWLIGRYEAGRVAGKWQQWNETGSKVADGQYRDGVLINGAPVALPAICETIKP